MRDFFFVYFLFLVTTVYISWMLLLFTQAKSVDLEIFSCAFLCQFLVSKKNIALSLKTIVSLIVYICIEKIAIRIVGWLFVFFSAEYKVESVEACFNCKYLIFCGYSKLESWICESNSHKQYFFLTINVY